METTSLIQEMLNTAKEIESLVTEKESLAFELEQARDLLADCESALDAVKAPTSNLGSRRLNTAGRIRELVVPSYILEREAYFANEKADKLLRENEQLVKLNSELKEQLTEVRTQVAQDHLSAKASSNFRMSDKF